MILNQYGLNHMHSIKKSALLLVLGSIKMKKALLVSLATLFTASMAQAAPVTVNGGTVHFTGDFVNAACAISSDSTEQTVKLGQYRTAEITAAAQYTNSVPFKINFVGCDSTVAKTSKVAFTGTADGTDKTLLRVGSGVANGKAAAGVGIEISDVKGAALSPDGTVFSAPHTITDGANTMNFTARYKSTAAAVTAGPANADATFVITYE